jgi:ankyrin repeat protein
MIVCCICNIISQLDLATPALHRAVQAGDVEAVRRLLRSGGVDVNQPHPVTGDTPLHWAVDKELSDVVCAHVYADCQ